MEIRLEIQATPFAVTTNSSDKVAWACNSRGEFELKSAYRLTIAKEEKMFKGDWVWKMNTLPKIKFFVWKCLHNSIEVKDCLAKRGIQIDATCPLCRRNDETIIHALQDCDLIRPEWTDLQASAQDNLFFQTNVHDWFSKNAKVGRKFGQSSMPWNCVFLFAVWTIWQRRNAFIFQNKPHFNNITAEII